MPLLPTFSASKADLPVSGGRRADAAELGSTNAELAQLAGTAGKAAQTYLQDAEEHENRKALVTTTQIRAKYAAELDAATLDGRDLGKLKESMQTDLAKVGEGFQTRKGQDSLAIYSANTELMYDEQASRINVQRASAEAHRDGSQFLNNWAATLRANPLALPMAEQEAAQLAATFTRVPAQDRIKIADGLKKELNMAAAVSTARVDPENTKKRLEAGEWDLSPAQREHAIARTDTEIRAKRADEAYQYQVAQHKRTEEDNKARDTYFPQIVAGTASKRAILDDATLTPQTREHLILMMEHRAKEMQGQEKKSDPVVYRDLWLRIHAADTDPAKIYGGTEIFNAVHAGKLNTIDADRLNQAAAGQRDENGRSIGQRAAATSAIVQRAIAADPSMIAQPDLVAAAQIDYNTRVDDKIKEYRDAGKNPQDLFNQANKDFVGTPQFIQSSINNAKQMKRGEAQAQVPDLRVLNDAGVRTDGTAKGLGFLGALKRPDGKVSTELSVGVNLNGKEMDIPLLVPTLSKEEIKGLLADEQPSEAVVSKAVAHARKRIAEGKPVFATIEEAIPVGSVFIDPNGVQRTMTKALQDALKKQAPAAPAADAKSSGQSLYEESAGERAEDRREAGTSFQRLKNVLTGERPTRESNEEYRRRKGDK